MYYKLHLLLRRYINTVFKSLKLSSFENSSFDKMLCKSSVSLFKAQNGDLSLDANLF